jgi:hypothetical protein
VIRAFFDQPNAISYLVADPVTPRAAVIDPAVLRTDGSDFDRLLADGETFQIGELSRGSPVYARSYAGRSVQ